MIFFKSLLFTIYIVVVTGVEVWVAYYVDGVIGFENFRSTFSIIVGIVLLVVAFLIRLWATYHFYRENLRIVMFKPQHVLVATGPFQYSRNPLFIGLVIIFLGFSLILGTWLGLAITVVATMTIIVAARKEEKWLEETFDRKYRNYKNSVRRWI